MSGAAEHEAVRWARRYASLGWSVFPCQRGGKLPATGHGFKDATCDPGEIARRWPEGSNLNVGAAVPNGLIVLDIDSAEAMRALKALDCELPTTATQRTPRGGWHLIYSLPEGVTVRQTAGEVTSGVDTRVAGKGYIVVAPSRVNGSVYSWETPPKPENISEAPGWLVEKLAETDRPRPAPKVEDTIPSGRRNETLASLAGTMRRRGMEEPEILAALRETNTRRCAPPLPEREVEAISRSVARYPAATEAETASVAGAVGGREAVAVRLSDVEPEDVTFLWEPYLPAGKLAILEGDPGAGKTWIALAVAATVSSGGAFPGRDSMAPAPVLYVTFEDGVADTLRPRLDRLGADCSRIEALTGWRENGEDRGPVTASEVDLLRREVERLRPALVVVDPIQGYIGASVDMNRANETRPVLAALSRLAEDSGAVVLVVRHLRKSGADRAAYRGLGSIDFTAAARSVLLVGEDPCNPENRVVAQHKCSVAPKGSSLGFSLDGGVFGWTGESDLTAEALLAPRPGESERSELEEAADYLREELADGPAPVKDLEGGAPCSKRTLERAKKRLGVQARKADFKGRWEWFLPDSQPSKAAKDMSGGLREPEHRKSQSAEGDSPRPPSPPGRTFGGLRETPVSESQEAATGDPVRCPRCRSPYCRGCGDAEPVKGDEVEL